MSICTLQETLDFLDISKGYFEVASTQDILKLTYDGGDVTDVECSDGTYSGSELATEIQSKIDAAFTISSTVSYASEKFTIDVGAGHTIAYTHAGSDLGLTVGFNQNHSAAQTITSDISAGDPTAIIQTLLNSVDAWVKGICDRDFEQTDYVEYQKVNSKYVFLKQFPVISISRMSARTQDALKVRYTGDVPYASIQVTASSVVLRTSSATTLTFTDYATLTEMATAIDGESGWAASVTDSDYDTYASTELIKDIAYECSVNDTYVQILEEAEEEYLVDHDNGIITLQQVVSSSMRIDYTAGYATIPEDLKLAVLMIINFIYKKREDETFGVASYSIGHIRKGYDDFPQEAKNILNLYWKAYA